MLTKDLDLLDPLEDEEFCCSPFFLLSLLWDALMPRPQESPLSELWAGSLGPVQPLQSTRRMRIPGPLWGVTETNNGRRRQRCHHWRKHDIMPCKGAGPNWKVQFRGKSSKVSWLKLHNNSTISNQFVSLNNLSQNRCDYEHVLLQILNLLEFSLSS